jgi:hypothetical protein
MRRVSRALLAILLGCGSPAAPDAGLDAGTDARGEVDAPGHDAGTACPPMPGDYTPRIAMSSTDGWPPCISDAPGPDGPFTPIGISISTIARVEAFETMFGPGGALGDPTRDPTPAEFTDGRALYEIDQGLGSRVIRRSDEHEPRPTPFDCQMGAVVSANLDYCVGPSQLAWIVREGFVAGMTGAPGPSRLHAARIEAALTWFLVLSVYKESLSCTTAIADCDSQWAYYTGGVNDRAGGLGLARLVRAADPETHERTWDATLAVRCWRDLDPMPVATMLELRDRARAQVDRSLDRGAALVIADRLRRMSASTGDEQRAHHEWLRTLLARLPAHTIPNPDPGGPPITVPERESLADRMIRARSPADADFVAAEMDGATAPADVDAAEIALRLEALFPCP